MSQALAAEGQGAKHASTPGPGFATVLVRQTESGASSAETSFPPLSEAQSSTVQGSTGPGPAGGSPGAVHKLLCCPLTQVIFDHSRSLLSN